MRISVALCTRNGSAFVREQVRSILEQKLLPDELIVSDDASSDGTLDLVRRAFDQLPVAHRARSVELRILSNPEPLGVTKNFQQAVTEARGELIALCDQDDSWHPSRLAAQAARFEAETDLGLLFTDAALVDATGRSLDLDLFSALGISAGDIASVHGGDAFQALLRRNLATGATIMFRRSLLDAALPFPPEWVHDEWLAIIASAVSRVDLLESSLVDYRQHGSNEVGVVRPTLRRKVARVFQPRGQRNAGLVVRSLILHDRLKALAAGGVPLRDDAVAETSAKARMEAFRAELPTGRLRRIRPVLHAQRSGWYSRYASQGRADMLRDVLQPHR